MGRSKSPKPKNVEELFFFKLPTCKDQHSIVFVSAGPATIVSVQSKLEGFVTPYAPAAYTAFATKPESEEHSRP